MRPSIEPAHSEAWNELPCHARSINHACTSYTMVGMKYQPCTSYDGTHKVSTMHQLRGRHKVSTMQPATIVGMKYQSCNQLRWYRHKVSTMQPSTMKAQKLNSDALRTLCCSFVFLLGKGFLSSHCKNLHHSWSDVFIRVLCLHDYVSVYRIKAGAALHQSAVPLLHVDAIKRPSHDAAIA